MKRLALLLIVFVLLLSATPLFAASTYQGAWTSHFPGVGKLTRTKAVNTHLAYIGVNASQLLKLTDNLNGNAIQLDPSLGKQSITAISYVTADAGVAFAVGDLGRFYSSTNGFTTWSSIDVSLLNTKLTGVSFIDGRHGFISGTGYVSGNVLYTGDGTHFNSLTIGTSEFKSTDIAFRDSKNGLVCGYYGTGPYASAIFQTTTGGTREEDWSNVFLWGYPSLKLNSIQYVNSQECWSVGTGGLIFESKDGGGSWNPVASGTTQNLLSVKFVNDQVGWIVGDNNTILMTTNEGKSWITQGPIVEGVYLGGVDFYYTFLCSNYGFSSGYTDGPTPHARLETYNLPIISQVSPQSIKQGSSETVTLTGANFENNLSLSIYGTTDAAFSNVNVVSSSEITATFTSSPSGVLGAKLIKLNNPDTTFTLSLINVTSAIASHPTISSVTPGMIYQGVSENFVIIGTDFQSNAQLSFSGGSGLSVGTTTFVSPTEIDATIVASPTADATSYSLSITNPDFGATTEAGAITVVSPSITRIDPLSIKQGETNKIFTINGMGFLPGAIVSFGAAGVTAQIPTTITSTEIITLVSASTDAQIGSTYVGVTNPGGNLVFKADALSVASSTAESISIEAMTPSSIKQGETKSFEIVGTNFKQGLRATFSGNGLYVATFESISSSTITGSFSALSNADIGAKDLQLINADGGSGSLRNAVAVISSSIGNNPSIESVTPASAYPGQKKTLIITGTNFPDPSSLNSVGLDFLDTALKLTNVTKVSTTQVRAVLDVSTTNVRIGTYNLSCVIRDLSNIPIGSAVLDNAFTVKLPDGNYCDIKTINPWNPSKNGDLIVKLEVLDAGTYRLIMANPDRIYVDKNMTLHSGVNTETFSSTYHEFSNGMYIMTVSKDGKILGKWKLVVAQ